MKGNLKFILLVVALFLILFSSTASASIIEKRITTHGTASSPDIYGNTVVWVDGRNGNIDISDIYALDLSTKKETHITGPIIYGPAISGNKIVWYDISNNSTSLTHNR